MSSRMLRVVLINIPSKQGRLRDQDPCFRAVVFSQFTSFLDLIEVVLRRDEFSFFRFDGEMSVKNKAAAVEEFTKPSRNGKVFVVSLKAGGVGLNVCFGFRLL